MSATPPPQTVSVSVCMSDAELQALTQYAQAHGMTLDQAATHAVSQQLQARYVTSKRLNNIVRFPK